LCHASRPYREGMSIRARHVLAALVVALAIPLAAAQPAYDAEVGIEASTRFGVQPYALVRFLVPLTDAAAFGRLWFMPEVGAWTNWAGIPERGYARVGVILDATILTVGADVTQRIGAGWTESTARAFVRASW